MPVLTCGRDSRAPRVPCRALPRCLRDAACTFSRHLQVAVPDMVSSKGQASVAREAFSISHCRTLHCTLLLALPVLQHVMMPRKDCPHMSTFHLWPLIDDPPPCPHARPSLQTLHISLLLPLPFMTKIPPSCRSPQRKLSCSTFHHRAQVIA